MESLQGVTQTAVMPIESLGPFVRIVIAAGSRAASRGIGPRGEHYHPEHRHDLVADSTGFLVIVLALCAGIRARGSA